MKALGTMFAAVVLTAGIASAQVPPIDTPPDSPNPGQHPGRPPMPGQPVPPVVTGQPPETGGTPADQSGSSEKSKAQEFKAQVVSVDAQSKTITVKRTDAGTSTSSTEQTLPVDSKAEPSLKKVSAGDQVKLTCRLDESGGQVVDKIEHIDTRPASDLPPEH